ncbi:MAG: hypothetical protein H7Y11_00405 [Armatimonadetes bacterium]|nr:hypothetical protein [Anaerolineae bacterium]
MVVFSFVVNLILVIVLLGLVLVIFDIKNNIAQPLVTGLHSSFIGLDQATIDWTIPVRADVPVNLDIPLNQNTVVVLTAPVPINVVAQIYTPNLTLSNATVSLTLPEGLELPVSLNLPVEVRDSIPVELDVRAVIPLADTQLHDVAQSLRLLFDPLAIGLTNLPNNYGEVLPFVQRVIAGEENLLAENDYTQQPWAGFSMTAGLYYDPALLTAPVPPQNVPMMTGIIPLGGIPLLDAQTRPAAYGDDSTPPQVNAGAYAAMQALGVPPQFYDGSYALYRLGQIGGLPATP